MSRPSPLAPNPTQHNAKNQQRRTRNPLQQWYSTCFALSASASRTEQLVLRKNEIIASSRKSCRAHPPSSRNTHITKTTMATTPNLRKLYCVASNYRKRNTYMYNCSSPTSSTSSTSTNPFFTFSVVFQKPL